MARTRGPARPAPACPCPAATVPVPACVPGLGWPIRRTNALDLPLARVLAVDRVQGAIIALAILGASVSGPTLADSGDVPVLRASVGEPVRMQGVVAAIGDQLGFAPCEGAPSLLLDASPAGDVAELIAAMEGHPRGSAAVDADFLVHADAPWELVRLRRIHVGDRACDGDLADFVWRAHGDGDTWSLAISPRRLLLRHRDHAVPASFRYRPFELVEPGVRVLQASEGGDAIHLVLRSGRCGDAADGRITDYSIEITWRGTRYEGCAWNGDPRR